MNPVMLDKPAGSASLAATHMYREASEAAEVVRAQFERNRLQAEKLGSILRSQAPRVVITCARGSSDHAADRKSVV